MSADPLIRAVSRAVRAGVELSRNPDGTLEITAPPESVYLGRALRAREADILALGDWRRADVAESARCILCGGSAMLRDPIDKAPCHKVCWDSLWISAAPPVSEPRGGGRD